MKRIVLATAIITFTIAATALAQRGGAKPAVPPHGSSAPVSHESTSSHATTPAHTTTAHTTTTHTNSTTHTTTTTHTSIPPQLARQLHSRLPTGTNLQTARAGFKNLGQFVAAVNVSHNLGIPFSQLRTLMVDRHMSLGQAIQVARPSTTSPTTVATRAEHDADEQIRESRKTVGGTSSK